MIAEAENATPIATSGRPLIALLIVAPQRVAGGAIRHEILRTSTALFAASSLLAAVDEVREVFAQDVRVASRVEQFRSSCLTNKATRMPGPVTLVDSPARRESER